MNVINSRVRRACWVAAWAVLVGQAGFSNAQTVLIDFGNDHPGSFRGLSVDNPDSNGNFWNSVQPGLLLPLVGINNAATGMQIGWDTPVATDSYNGPAGVTDAATLETDVLFTDIDPVALGLLAGALAGPFDFAAGFNGLAHFPVRFQIQGLNPAARYDLTFFGSHKFSNDTTTVYTVFTDNTYTTPVASTMLDVWNPLDFTHNRDRVATIEGVAPQTDNILYIQFVGATGFGGYLNDMLIEGAATPLNGDYDGDGDVDGDDLVVWKGEFGQGGPHMADGDGDGDADGADFLIWQRELGLPGQGAAVGAIPEPAGLALLVVGLIARPAAVRRRRCK